VATHVELRLPAPMPVKETSNAFAVEKSLQQRTLAHTLSCPQTGNKAAMVTFTGRRSRPRERQQLARERGERVCSGYNSQTIKLN
jgi:hypothetical protein